MRLQSWVHCPKPAEDFRQKSGMSVMRSVDSGGIKRIQKTVSDRLWLAATLLANPPVLKPKKSRRVCADLEKLAGPWA